MEWHEKVENAMEHLLESVKKVFTEDSNLEVFDPQEKRWRHVGEKDGRQQKE